MHGRLVRMVATLSVVLLMPLAGCGGGSDAPGDQGGSEERDQTIGGSATVLHGVAVGDYNDHPYTVEVAHGWTTDEHHHFMFKAAAEALFMSVWRVGEVPTDPCHWKGTEVDAGPSVAKLVEQLTTQRSRKASAPKDTTLAGYDGRYFEWSVPEDLVQTGDSEFESCDDPGTGSPHFYSWFGEYGGGRYQQVAGQRDRIWVLDVRGQTMVVDASYTPAATAADRMELDQAVASLQFQGP